MIKSWVEVLAGFDLEHTVQFSLTKCPYWTCTCVLLQSMYVVCSSRVWFVEVRFKFSIASWLVCYTHVFPCTH